MPPLPYHFSTIGLALPYESTLYQNYGFVYLRMLSPYKGYNDFLFSEITTPPSYKAEYGGRLYF